jgi:hypothetical protein
VSLQGRRKVWPHIFPNKKEAKMDSIMHVGETVNLVLALAAHTMMIIHYRKK